MFSLKTLRRIGFYLAAGGLCILPVCVLADNLPGSDLVGRWRVVAVLDSAEITAIDDRQAEKLLGKTLEIRKGWLEFDGRVCKNPSYERTVEETERSFREKGHVSSVNMHLPDPVTAINAKCTDLFIKGQGKIVFHWKGFYFDAVREGK